MTGAVPAAVTVNEAGSPGLTVSDTGWPVMTGSLTVSAAFSEVSVMPSAVTTHRKLPSSAFSQFWTVKVSVRVPLYFAPSEISPPLYCHW